MNQDITQLIHHLARRLSQNRQKICTAESCTGGLIAKSMTDLAGSSGWFERGFVTYSNEAKTQMLGVDASIIEHYGAVSEPVAAAMARGALAHSLADVAIAVTGVAGPDGGSEQKPVGTVWVAVATDNQLVSRHYVYKGDRDSVRQQTLCSAINNAIELIGSE